MSLFSQQRIFQSSFDFRRHVVEMSVGIFSVKFNKFVRRLRFSDKKHGNTSEFFQVKGNLRADNSRIVVAQLSP